MSGVVNFVVSILKLGIFYAIMGEITDVTKIMMNEAAKALLTHKNFAFDFYSGRVLGRTLIFHIY